MLDTMMLPTAGTYTVDLGFPDAAPNAATVRLLRVPADVSAGAAIDGGEVTVTTTAPGQNAAVTFPVQAAGGKVTVRCQATVDTSASVRAPDGGVLAWFDCPAGGRTVTVGPAAPGTYRVEIDPGADRTGSATVQVRSAS
jgi:hypothetical protein